MGKQNSDSGEFLKHRKGVQKMTNGHKNLSMKGNQSSKQCASSYWQWLLNLPSHGTGGNTGHPKGAGKELFECFLLTSFTVLQSVPDGRKSLHRPLAGPFSKSWPSTTAQGQAARAAGKTHLHRHNPFSITIRKFNWHTVGKRTCFQALLLCIC